MLADGFRCFGVPVVGCDLMPVGRVAIVTDPVLERFARVRTAEPERGEGDGLARAFGHERRHRELWQVRALCVDWASDAE